MLSNNNMKRRKNISHLMVDSNSKQMRTPYVYINQQKMKDKS